MDYLGGLIGFCGLCRRIMEKDYHIFEYIRQVACAGGAGWVGESFAC